MATSEENEDSSVTYLRYLQRECLARGYGKVKRIIHTPTILHKGWRMDNQAWLVEMEDGEHRVFTTINGGVYPHKKEEAGKKLAETLNAAESLKQLLALWPAS